MYYTYVLKCNDGERYVGCTANLRKRIREHRQGLVTATKLRLPIEPVYYEACLNKEKAYAREKYFKTGFGRRYLDNRT